jgi:hypothetical protein
MSWRGTYINVEDPLSIKDLMDLHIHPFSSTYFFLFEAIRYAPIGCLASLNIFYTMIRLLRSFSALLCCLTRSAAVDPGPSPRVGM